MQNKLMVALGLVVLIGIAGLLVYASMHPKATEAPATTAEQTTTATTTADQKLNISVVCQGALSYMTFNGAADAEKFMTECVAGEHPEVIERYKADHNLNGATI